MENENSQKIGDKYNDLKPYQQNIINHLFDNFILVNVIDIFELIGDDLICRKCSKSHFVKNGTSNWGQRYLCKSCRSTQYCDTNKQ